MAKKQIDLGLTGLDELFMDDRERAESRLPKIHEIPLSEIDEFPNHPFHVRLDEDMDQLVESIKERGIITPVTLRQKPDGRYEIVSGHRRTKACELAGLATVKAEIKELSRDEAIILMVESNLQRTTILSSEKAFSYKMRLEAMKRQQGERTDLTSVPVGQRFGKTSREVLADSSTDSNTQIQRYIRLTHLIPPLLDLVDSGKIAFRPADSQYTYTFTGWQGYTNGMTISGNVTFTAQYAAKAVESVPKEITTGAYRIADSYLRAIPMGTTARQLLANLSPSDYITLPVQGDSLVGTGMTVTYARDGQTIQTLTTVVTGDLSGDGRVTITDMVRLQAHLLGKTSLTGAALQAADLNGDGQVTITDMVRLQAYLLGRGTIQPN